MEVLVKRKPIWIKYPIFFNTELLMFFVIKQNIFRVIVGSYI